MTDQEKQRICEEIEHAINPCKWSGCTHENDPVRNWFEPAAAMELLKRMRGQNLGAVTLYGSANIDAWECALLASDGQFLSRYAETPEEAIVLAFRRSLKHAE